MRGAHVSDRCRRARFGLIVLVGALLPLPVQAQEGAGQSPEQPPPPTFTRVLLQHVEARWVLQVEGLTEPGSTVALRVYDDDAPPREATLSDPGSSPSGQFSEALLVDELRDGLLTVEAVATRKLQGQEPQRSATATHTLQKFTTAAAVESMTPAAGSTVSGRRPELSLRFNRVMQLAGAPHMPVTIRAARRGSDGAVIDGTLRISNDDGRDVAIDYQGLLEGGEYTVAIDSPALLDEFRRPFPGQAGSYWWTFTVDNDAVTPPIISEVYPRVISADARPPLSDNAGLRLSGAAMPDSELTLALADVADTVRVNNTAVYADHRGQWSYAFAANVVADLRDGVLRVTATSDAGVHTVEINKDTLRPQLGAHEPAQDATATTWQPPIIVQFDEALFAGDNFRDITLTDDAQQAMPIISSLVDNELRITPAVPLNDGRYELYLPHDAVRDQVGNSFTASSGEADDYRWSFTVHAPVPPPPTIASAQPQLVNGGTRRLLTVQGSARPGDEIAVQAQGGQSEQYEHTVTDAQGQWSLQLDTQRLPDGPITLQAVATAATLPIRQSEHSNSVTVQKDALLPMAVAVSPDDLQTVDSSTPTIAVTFDEPIMVTATTSATLLGSDGTARTLHASAQDDRLLLTAEGPFGDGVFEVLIPPGVISDVAGNYNITIRWTFVVDAPPQTPRLDAASPEYGNGMVTAHGSGRAGELVQVELRDIVGTTATSAWMPVSRDQQSWTALVDGSALSDGVLEVTAIAAEAGGQQRRSSASAALFVNKDTQAPLLRGEPVGIVTTGQPVFVLHTQEPVTASQPHRPLSVWRGARLIARSVAAESEHTRTQVTIDFVDPAQDSFADGVYRVEVPEGVVQDRAGNASASLSWDFEIEIEDLRAPTLDVVLPALLSSRSGTVLQLSGRVQEGAAVQVTASVGAAVLQTSSALADASGLWRINDFDVAALPDGDVYVLARAFDLDDEYSTASEPRTVHKDTEGPHHVALSPPADATLTSSNAAVSVTFAEEIVAGPGLREVTLRRLDSAEQEPAVVVALLDGRRLELQYLPQALRDGRYRVTVPQDAVLDALGNGNTALSWTFTVDAPPPAPAVHMVMPAIINAAQASSVRVHGSGARNGDVVQVQAHDDTGATVTADASAVDVRSGSWSATVDVRDLRDGTLQFTAALRDAAGQTGADSTPVRAQKDATAPTATTTTPQTRSETSRPTIAVQYSEPVSVRAALSDVSLHHEVFGPATVIAAQYDPTTITITPTLPLRDGAYVVSVPAQAVADLVGNHNAALSWQFMVDTGQPHAPVLRAVSPPVITASSAMLRADGSGEPGVLISVQVTDRLGRVVGRTASTRIDDDGFWSVEGMPVETLADGALTVQATARAINGVDSAASNRIEVVKDTTGPTFITSTPRDGDLSNQAQPEISAAFWDVHELSPGPGLATVSLQTPGGPDYLVTACLDNPTGQVRIDWRTRPPSLAATPTTSACGNPGLDYLERPDLPDGTWTVRIPADAVRDPWGHGNAASSFVFTVDRTAPELPLFDDLPGINNRNADALVLRGTAMGASVVDVWLHDIAVASLAVPLDGIIDSTISLRDAHLPEGYGLALTAIAYDDAGNHSPTATMVVDRDLQAPAWQLDATTGANVVRAISNEPIATSSVSTAVTQPALQAEGLVIEHIDVHDGEVLFHLARAIRGGDRLRLDSDFARDRVGNPSLPAQVVAALEPVTFDVLDEVITSATVEQFTFEGQGPPLALIALTITDGNDRVELTVPARADGHWVVPAVDLSALTDTTLTFSAVASRDGLVGATSHTQRLKDTAVHLRLAPQTTPLNGDDSPQVRISGTADPFSQVSVFMVDEEGLGAQPVAPGGLDVATVEDGSFAVDVHLQPLADGLLEVWAYATDPVGNNELVHDTWKKVGKHWLRLTGTATTVNATGTQAFTVRGGVERNVDTVHVRIADHNQPAGVLEHTVNVDDGRFSQRFDLSTLADGELQIEARADDNGEEDRVTRAVMKDASAPPVPVTLGLSQWVNATTQHATVVRYRTEPAASFTVQALTADGVVHEREQVADEHGETVATFDFANNAEGEIVFSAWAEDAFANRSETSSDTAVLDRTPPDAPVDVVLPDLVDAHNHDAVAMAATAGGIGDRIITTIFAPGSSTAALRHVSSAASADDPRVSWSLSLAELTNGSLRVLMQAQDQAGNHSAVQEFTVHKNVPAPPPRAAHSEVPQPAQPITTRSSGVVRLRGTHRIATAAALARLLFADAQQAYVTVADGFADALAAGPAAASQHAPVLLSERNDLSQATADYISDVRPRQIVLLGGLNAISSRVAAQVAALGSHVTRIAGSDRYATAAALSARHFAPGVAEVYLSSGEAFADALAGGAAAAANNAPVLLSGTQRLPVATAAELRRLRPRQIIVLGGSAAISASVAQQLGTYARFGVRRIAGRERYETAAAVADDSFVTRHGTVYVATGEGFADALAAVPAAAAEQAPLVLAPPTGLPTHTRALLQRLAPTRLVLLGGAGAISAGTQQQLEQYVRTRP